jgi:hypothetical protein
LVHAHPDDEVCPLPGGLPPGTLHRRRPEAAALTMIISWCMGVTLLEKAFEVHDELRMAKQSGKII